MFDQIMIGVCCIVLCYPFETIKQIARLNLHEAIYADIAHIGRAARQTIADIAVFLDVLPAWAICESRSNTGPQKRSNNLTVAE